MTETIGQRLRRVRLERGLSQRALGGDGVSYAHISRIEAGSRQASVKALRMLARKLGVTADYLETGEGGPDVVRAQRALLVGRRYSQWLVAADNSEHAQRIDTLIDRALAALERETAVPA
jgi:transcriptional regulator with XRE-family HTH domain